MLRDPLARLLALAMIRWFAVLLAVTASACSPTAARSAEMQFTGVDAALERAIGAGDAHAVDAAIAAGADANAHGAHGVSPLEFAVGTFRKQAARALIRHRADPNRKDDEGDNAVTLAVTAYARDPELLAIVLDAGGDPNTSRSDGRPVITRFCRRHGQVQSRTSVRQERAVTMTAGYSHLR